MSKKFKVKGKLAKAIIHVASYWWYYDSGYNVIISVRGNEKNPLYSGINRDITRFILCDSQTTIDRDVIEEGEYEFQIEHHDYDYITKAHEALIKQAKEWMKPIPKTVREKSEAIYKAKKVLLKK